MTEMRELSGGEAVVESLRVEECSYIFGLIGSAGMEIFDALYDAKDIKLIGVHDERTGAHMADGYARASGKAGVVLAGQNGPGATNLITGLAQAKAAFSPMVSIAGMISSDHIYRDGFQEVDQQALFTPVTKKTWTVPYVRRIPELFREAFRTAHAPRSGPVHLNIPRDILAMRDKFPPLLQPSNYRCQTMPAANDDDIKLAAQMLQDANAPVIIVGGGIKNSGGAGAVLKMAEFFNIPLVTSPGHGDAIPFGHPLNAGQMGPRGNLVASRLVKQADVILALGTRIGFNSTFYSYDNINISAKIIQVELHQPSIARYFPITLGIWADAKTVAQQLNERGERVNARINAQKWVADFQTERQEYLKKNDEDALALLKHEFIQPAMLFKHIRDHAPHDSAFTLDAGTLCLQATDALHYHQGKSLFTPLDFGLVGFSYACGLGVKLAMPNRPVISLMGDGGFGMTVSELTTAVEYNIPTVTIVMNNKCWGAEKAYQRDFFNGRYIGADISSPPFDKLAELYGARGFAVENIHDFPDALKAAIACNAPAVIDVSVDASALYSFRRDSFKHRSN